MVYKFGIFRRAHILANKKDYKSSYKILFENFNLMNIKGFFDLSYNQDKDIIFEKDSMFYYENLGFEREKLPTNYERLKEKHY